MLRMSLWNGYKTKPETRQPTGLISLLKCMDIFGYSFFISFLFAFIPQLIIDAWSSLLTRMGSNPEKGQRQFSRSSSNYIYSAEKRGLLTILIMTAFFTITFSFQMVIYDSSLFNAILVTVEFAFVRTFFYTYKGLVSIQYPYSHNVYIQYFYDHFPPEISMTLYLINTIGCGIGNYMVDPIYTNFILSDEGEFPSNQNWETG